MNRFKSLVNGIHFRVLTLVFGLAVMLVAVQLVSDTFVDTRKAQAQRYEDAVTITNVLARSLENQFDFLELSEIEKIIGNIRQKNFVKQVLVVDREQTFFLDGDLATPSLMAFEEIPEQVQSIEQGVAKTSIVGTTITVAEPLMRNGGVIGSIAIRFENPSLGATALPIVASNLMSSIPLLLVGLIIGNLLMNQIAVPLRRLSVSAQQIAEGHLDTEVPVEGPNEIKQLGASISLMISKLKHNIEQIYELAYVDRTTRLPNREFFRKELTRAIKRAARQEIKGALLFVDLDGFKRVNDTHGHDIGDELLTIFSERLANILRAEDLIGFDPKNHTSVTADGPDTREEKKNQQMLARLGGDEFTVLLSEIRDETDAATVAKRIIEAVREPFEIRESRIKVGASVGIATFPRDGSDYQTILKSADMAMYQAKEEGKNTYRYYSDELNAEASRKMEIEADLRQAIDCGSQLELYYQPKIDCADGRPRSVEALIRWNHPKKGMIQPLEFIRIAEDSGLILPMGRWILEEACRQLVKFREAGMDLSVAVNISPAQFERPDLATIVREVLSKTGADPSKLELELTESMAMQNPDMALKHIHALKALGIRFAIDDFGTGYSNLSQLSQLPFDVFKIDRTFVESVTREDNEHGRIIVRTILAMAHSLEYETVAEGVETEAEFEFLRKNGCTFAQGYHFARPMPESQFMEWFSSWATDNLPEQVNKPNKRSKA